jgi:hypothetical protein
MQSDLKYRVVCIKINHYAYCYILISIIIMD